jgi:hypothetical protein
LLWPFFILFLFFVLFALLFFTFPPSQPVLSARRQQLPAAGSKLFPSLACYSAAAAGRGHAKLWSSTTTNG